MEACSGAHWLSRKIMSMGHTVLLIPPQYVKPYVKTNKSDFADAEAICEAASRPSMRFVAVKGAAHLDLQAVHRVRSSRVGRRTAVINEIRALLTEAGIVFAKGPTQVRKLVPTFIADLGNELTADCRDLVQDLFSELLALDARIERLTNKLTAVAEQNEACRRILAVEGVGPMTATAIVAACPDPSHFRNGRHFAAWIGLVPKHSGTGGKVALGGISKRGDTQLRVLLIHGARTAIKRAHTKDDRRSKWVTAIKERRGYNKATVALANKNARIIWALLRYEGSYKAA
jgi:transposase